MLATLLDNAVQIPGMKQTVGLDPVLGLVPVVGDALCAAASLWIVYDGYKMGASKGTVAKMLINVGLDAAVGAVPVLGDLADFGLKCNTRNARLLGIEPRRPFTLDLSEWLSTPGAWVRTA